MNIKGFSISSYSFEIDGDLTRFEERLRTFQELGFECVEFPSHLLDIILGGKFNPARLQEAVSILKRFNLTYTIHQTNNLNLCDLGRLPMMREVFKRNLEFANMIGAEMVVYHSGSRVKEQRSRTLEELMEVEREELFRLGEIADGYGVSIGVENRDPTLEIINDPEIHYYGLYLDRLYKQVQAVNHPRVGICLDYGHAFLAAKYCGYNYIESIRAIMGLVHHLHVNDNFGIVTSVDRSYSYTYSYGEDDLHLPIGWGEVPYSELFRMECKPSLLVFELKSRFLKDAPSCIQEAKRLIGINN